MQDIFKNFGIYLHVPFCVQNCDYCKFYKRTPNKTSLDSYIDAIAKEIYLAKSQFKKDLKKPETMFWGGGTPSILSEKNIEQIAESFGELLPTKEWTVEVAPTNATTSRLQTLKDVGVNRISMGVQSFNEKTLQTLGRKHSLKSTLQAIDRIADVGFEHFSIDLIFGTKGQTPQEWLDDIERASHCPVDHISAYCLEFESATSCCRGRLPDEDYQESEREGEFLEIAMTRLEELGFAQYEISNYAKPNGKCLHNLSTWNMAQWLGFGPAGASQFAGKRFRNTPDFDKWLSGINAHSPILEDIVELNDDELFADSLIFGLRMVEGVNFPTLCERFPKANHAKYLPTIDFLESEGLLEKSENKIKLTKRGRLVADAIAVELL